MAQHTWAQMSEAYSSVFGREIKYGGGPAELQNVLLAWSEVQHQEGLRHVNRTDPQGLRAAWENVARVVDLRRGEHRGSAD
jgi:hypothetical protein